MIMLKHTTPSDHLFYLFIWLS